MDKIHAPFCAAESSGLSWWFWLQSVVDVIPRYLNGALFCSTNISYVLWSSELVTDIVWVLFVESRCYVPSLSWVHAMICMRHFEISSFLPEVYSSSSQDWAACWILFLILTMPLFFQSFAYCVLSSIKPKLYLEYFMSPFGLIIVQPLQFFSNAFIMGELVNSQFVQNSLLPGRNHR